MKRAYEMELVVKESLTVLKDGFSPGGVMKQVIVITVPDEELHSPASCQRHAYRLHQIMEEFLRDNIEVRVQEIPADQTETLLPPPIQY